ncbi:replication-associated recombination protein A [Candidatus Berkelbacteria bacterium]|nr:replication-associated recombination protein A [Candidatus Berkelbacteria bacterium]
MSPLISESRPLAARLRPAKLSLVVGQDHLLAPQKPLGRLIKTKRVPSLLLWGPPGTGKTTLAHLIAAKLRRPFERLSAVDGTVKEIRAILERAEGYARLGEPLPILFIDEIHRFNTAQQDTLLHAVEAGTVTLIGATTENPSFKINAPLLSRLRVFTLKPLDHTALHTLIRRALALYPEHRLTKEATEYFVAAADGDARTLLGSLEVAMSLSLIITPEVAQEAIQRKLPRYDRAGEEHFDTISAFIKSMRGSNADATLHYLARMLEAEEDPMFIARRMVIFASEDVGNVLPTALVLATATLQAVHMIGLPEAQLILAQCATYLATAPKSRAVTDALGAARHDVSEQTLEPIPLHLRNVVTPFMTEQGYGEGDQSPKTDGELTTPLGFLPPNLTNAHYYEAPKR